MDGRRRSGYVEDGGGGRRRGLGDLHSQSTRVPKQSKAKHLKSVSFLGSSTRTFISSKNSHVKQDYTDSI